MSLRCLGGLVAASDGLRFLCEKVTSAASGSVRARTGRLKWRGFEMGW